MFTIILAGYMDFLVFIPSLSVMSDINFPFMVVEKTGANMSATSSTRRDRVLRPTTKIAYTKQINKYIYFTVVCFTIRTLFEA